MNRKTKTRAAYVLKTDGTHTYSGAKAQEKVVTTYLCGLHGVQWWGTDVAYAREFASRKTAEDVVIAIKLSTHWAIPSNLRVSRKS